MTVIEPDDLLDSLREENEALLDPGRPSGSDERRVPAADGRPPDLVVVADHCAAAEFSPPAVRLARRRIRQLPERLAARPAPSVVWHRRALPARGAGARRARDGRQPVAGAAGARDGSSAAKASRLAVGRPRARGRARLLPGGLVRHRRSARPDSGAVRPRGLAGRRPHRGARAGDRRAAAAGDDPPRPEPRSRSRLARRAGRCRRLRRLRRDSQGAHEAQPAPDRRGRLAGRAARRADAVAGGHSPDRRAAAPRCSVGLVVPTGQPRRRRRRGARTRCSSRRWQREFPSPSIPTVLRYPAGSMYWARPWVLRRLADLRLGPEHFEPEASHVDGSTAHALERFVGVAAQASGLDVVDDRRRLVAAAPRAAEADPAAEGARLLPAAVPSDPRERRLVGNRVHRLGERRPRPPALRRAPAAGRAGRARPLRPVGSRGDAHARRRWPAEYGVDGFVMHHYWFDGRKLLDTPLRNLLDDPTIDFPFALCWANENWTRRWDGLDSDVLIAQSYSEGWADRFYDDILPALSDPRYITVDGRPLLVLYRIGHIKNARCGDRTLEGACARRRPRRPARPRGQPFPPFRGAAARRRGRRSTASCSSRRSPASGSSRSRTSPPGCPRATQGRRLLLRRSGQQRRSRDDRAARAPHPSGRHAGLGQHAEAS